MEVNLDMKKILLINPIMEDYDPVHSEFLSEKNVPLGVLCVGSYLSSKGYKVKVFDVNNFTEYQTFLNLLDKEMNGALCIGLSVMTSQIPDALRICEHVRDLDPSLKIVWGGVHPSVSTN